MITSRLIVVAGMSMGLALPTQADVGAGLGILRVSPIVAKATCVESIAMEPRQDQGCLSWTRRESAAPVLDAARQLVYVGGSDNALHVNSAKDGSLVKLVSLPSAVRGRPLLNGDHLYMGTDKGLLIKMKLDTYEVVWKTELDAEIDNQPVFDQNTLYVVSGLASVYAINPEDGVVKWQKKRPLPSHIFISVLSNLTVLNVKKDELSLHVLAVGHPSGRLDFLDAKNGDNVLDSLMLGDAASDFPDVAADPVIIDNMVAAASYNRSISLVNPSTGLTLWTTPEKEHTRLLYADGMLFAAGNKKVVGINPRSGDVIWRFEFKRGAPTRMVAKNGFLYVGSDRSAFYVLNARDGKPMQYLGSGLGFAGDFDFSSNTLFALSTAGYLYAMSPDFKGVVQQGNSTKSY